MTDRESAALRHIKSTYPTLDSWRQQGRRVESPKRGSELQVDARIGPGLQAMRFIDLVGHRALGYVPRYS